MNFMNLSEEEKNEILTQAKKNTILRLTIREFRNNFSKYRKAVENGAVIVVYNRKIPALIVLSFKENDILDG